MVSMADTTERHGTGLPGRALTLHQPWASLIAIGAKTMETRSWSTSYRGPLAIHAGAAPVARTLPENSVGEYCVGQTTVGETRHVKECACPDPDDGEWDPRCEALNRWVSALVHDEGAHGWTVAGELPFGAIVATCELVDVVPIVGPDSESAPCVVVEANGRLSFWSGAAGYWSGEQDERDVTSERSYGNFTLGRFAWILADVTPLEVPIPAKGHKGLWRWERPWDGPGVSRAGRETRFLTTAGRAERRGDEPVAGDRGT